MASKGKDKQYKSIRIRHDQWEALSKLGGPTKGLDNLLGARKKAPDKKKYESPQNSLIDCFICSALAIDVKQSLSKTQIYSTVLMQGVKPNNLFKTSWSDVYKDFFDLGTYLERKGAFRTKIDNRLNEASSLSKSGLVRRSETMNSAGDREPKYYLVPKFHKDVLNWSMSVLSLYPSDKIEIPNIESIDMVESVSNIKSSQLYKGLNRTLSIMMGAYKEALRLNEEPMKYFNKSKMEELIKKDMAEGDLETYRNTGYTNQEIDDFNKSVPRKKSK